MKKILAIALLLLGIGFSLSAQQTEDLDLQYGTELLKPGTPAPDFTLDDLDGNPVTLSSFRGRKVVLQFWATWCPDCRAEIPEIKAMQASADPSKVVFLAVSCVTRLVGKGSGICICNGDSLTLERLCTKYSSVIVGRAVLKLPSTSSTC